MSLSRKILASLGGWKGYAVVAGAALVVGTGGAWVVQGWRYGAEIADIERDHAKEKSDQAHATVVAIEAARTEERRRTAAVEKARDDAKKQTANAVAAAVRARAEHERLLAHVNALARTAVDRDPAAAVGSPAGASAVSVLAYVLGRVSDRATELAGVADRARIAGLTCERSYDQVRRMSP